MGGSTVVLFACILHVVIWHLIMYMYMHVTVYLHVIYNILVTKLSRILILSNLSSMILF